MRELQKRAARALAALLQNDPQTALEELNVYRLEMEDGEPIIRPKSTEFGYPCQECGKGTVHAKTIGVCDLCHGQHFSAREEKRYQNKARREKKEN